MKAFLRNLYWMFWPTMKELKRRQAIEVLKSFPSIKEVEAAIAADGSSTRHKEIVDVYETIKKLWR